MFDVAIDADVFIEGIYCCMVRNQASVRQIVEKYALKMTAEQVASLAHFAGKAYCERFIRNVVRFVPTIVDLSNLSEETGVVAVVWTGARYETVCAKTARSLRPNVMSSKAGGRAVWTTDVFAADQRIGEQLGEVKFQPIDFEMRGLRWLYCYGVNVGMIEPRIANSVMNTAGQEKYHLLQLVYLAQSGYTIDAKCDLLIGWGARYHFGERATNGWRDIKLSREEKVATQGAVEHAIGMRAGKFGLSSERIYCKHQRGGACPPEMEGHKCTIRDSVPAG